MKTALSSFDLKALVAEWQDLVGGYIDKVYQTGDELVLRIHLPQRGKAELLFKPGRWLCLHEVEEKPEAPPPFARSLRRLLDNARITAVEQRGFDRIVTLNAERGPETYRIVFEIFGKGNLVVVKEDTTLAALFPTTFKDRSVSPGEPYAFPPLGLDPLEADRSAFGTALRSAKGQVVRVLAAVLNLGGQYAEELCLRATVPKDTKVKELTETQIDALYTALNNVAVAVEQERQPAVIIEAGNAIDAIPIELAQYHGFERRPFNRFNEALSHYLKAAHPEEAEADVTAEKYARRIAQQEETLRALRETTGRLEAEAHFLYAHFAPFDELLRSIREGRPPPEGTQVKAVDRKAHTVAVAIGDFDTVTLDYEKDVTANAQARYEARREAQLKAQRVEEALAVTRQEMEAARVKIARVVAKPKVRGTKPMWFEAYRWCLSSEGHLILGGRDARSNDRLVKKHLKDGDRYAHADVHGAPSTVIKDGSRATEATLREACEFALAYSKAWSAGLAAGSAYWVLPEQVSKQAESGEYLPRGAFVIRGKRNYFHDLPVRAAVGEVEIEGHRKIMGGPVASVSARASKIVLLAPGKGDRQGLAKRLAMAFDVPIEEVVRTLPTGRVEVLETRGLTL